MSFRYTGRLHRQVFLSRRTRARLDTQRGVSSTKRCRGFSLSSPNLMLSFLVWFFNQNHFTPLTVPVCVPNSCNSIFIEVFLTEATRSRHRRRTISEKSCYVYNVTLFKLYTITQYHFSVSAVCHKIVSLIVKSQKLWRRLLVVSCRDNRVTVLYEGNNIVGRPFLSWRNFSYSVVLQSPCS